MNERVLELLQLPEAKNLDLKKRIENSTIYFDSLVNFLRNPVSFPNTQVNEVVTLLFRLVGNGHTPVVFYTSDNFPDFLFLVEKSEYTYAARLIMPFNFLESCIENPVFELGAVTFNASQARDYWSGTIFKDYASNRRQNSERRALALEAELILTLSELLIQNGQPLVLNEYQQQVLSRYPKGIKSLEKGIWYPTVEYIPPGIG